MDPDVPPSWGHAARGWLLAAAADDLAAGVDPRPRLIAFRGERLTGHVPLRPFERDELTDALLEALAGVLPAAIDRVAVSLPGSARWIDDDGRAGPPRPALVVSLADAAHGPCRVLTTVHPYVQQGRLTRWGAPMTDDRPAEGSPMEVVRVVLDARPRRRTLAPAEEGAGWVNG